jgi:hypothetical protein
MTFHDHPYQKAIFADEAKERVVIKSTQNGISEYLVILCLTSAIQGRNVFHVLPTDYIRIRFVQNRINKSISYTDYYRAVLRESRKDEGSRYAESMSTKHVGTGTVAFVSSRSQSSFSEFPADDVIIDELDECDQDNIIRAPERQSHSRDPKTILVANPSFLDMGIDREFKNTDQKHWYIKCECGHWFTPDWFTHVVRQIEDDRYIIRDPDYDPVGENDIRLICEKCGRPVNRFSQGVWASHEKHYRSGYRITKMFSARVPLRKTMKRFIRGLEDDEEMQRFYNADLGQAYTAKGAKIDDEMLKACSRDYLMPASSEKHCVAGIDVGKRFHVKISEILPDDTLRTVLVDSTRDEKRVVEWLFKYNVKCYVIDANPETRIARQIVQSKQGGFLCFYGGNRRDGIDVLGSTVTVYRTSALDNVKSAIMTERVLFPKNVLMLPEFAQHMTASTRVYDEKMNGGEGGYRWVEGSNPDHFFHSSAYELIAHRLYAMGAMR